MGRFFFYTFFSFPVHIVCIICSVYGHCTPNRRIVSTSPSLIPFFISHIFDQNENGITSTDKYGAMSLMPDNFFYGESIYLFAAAMVFGIPRGERDLTKSKYTLASSDGSGTRNLGFGV